MFLPDLARPVEASVSHGRGAPRRCAVPRKGLALWTATASTTWRASSACRSNVAPHWRHSPPRPLRSCCLKQVMPNASGTRALVARMRGAMTDEFRTKPGIARRRGARRSRILLGAARHHHARPILPRQHRAKRRHAVSTIRPAPSATGATLAPAISEHRRPFARQPAMAATWTTPICGARTCGRPIFPARTCMTPALSKPTSRALSSRGHCCAKQCSAARPCLMVPYPTAGATRPPRAALPAFLMVDRVVARLGASVAGAVPARVVSAPALLPRRSCAMTSVASAATARTAAAAFAASMSAAKPAHFASMVSAAYP